MCISPNKQTDVLSRPQGARLNNEAVAHAIVFLKNENDNAQFEGKQCSHLAIDCARDKAEKSRRARVETSNLPGIANIATLRPTIHESAAPVFESRCQEK